MLAILTNILVILTLGLVSTAHAGEAVTVVTFKYPGFMHKDPIPGKGRGFGVDLVSAAFKESNIEAVFEFQPMVRSISSLRSGKYVAMLGALRQYSEEDRKALTGVLYGYGRFLLYYLKSKHGEIKYDKLSELSEYTIGSVIGSSTNRVLEEAGVRPHPVSRMEQNFEKLVRGRIDMVVSIEITANDIINELFESYRDDIGVSEKPLLNLPLHLIFRNDQRKGLAERFKAGFEAVKANGTYMKLARTYYGPSVPPGAIVEELRSP